MNRAFETQAQRFDPSPLGGVPHERAHEVVGKQMNPQLSANHLGRARAQEFHLHRGLQAVQVRLHFPSAVVELGQRPRRIFLRVQQRRHEGDGLHAPAGNATSKAHQPHGLRLGEGVELLGGHPLRPRLFCPLHTPIVSAQRFALTKVHFPVLVETKHHVRTARPEKR